MLHNNNISIRKFFLSAIILITAAISFSILSCSLFKGPDGPFIELIVSKYHREHLAQLNKARYTEQEIAPLYAQMTGLGDSYCSYLWKQCTFDRASAEKYFRKDKVSYYKNLNCVECVSSLIAGCFNFFAMNDRTPDLDFLLLKKLLPSESYQCYSVGFMQPYMIHNIMKCSELHFVDFNWRIQEAHFQLLAMYRQNKFTSDGAMKETLKDLNIGWVAHHSAMRNRIKSGIELFCGNQRIGTNLDTAQQYELCSRTFMDFQKNISRLKKVRFHLAALHDVEYPKSEEGSMKIIFVSNALEDIYTTKEQFDLFLKQIEKSMSPGEKTAIVYHAGGKREFGVYTLTRNTQGSSITTLCRDPYPNTVRGKKVRFYSTYFEDISSNRTYPRCQDVVLEKGITRYTDQKSLDAPPGT